MKIIAIREAVARVCFGVNRTFRHTRIALLDARWQVADSCYGKQCGRGCSYKLVGGGPPLKINFP